MFIFVGEAFTGSLIISRVS